MYYFHAKDKKKLQLLNISIYYKIMAFVTRYDSQRRFLLQHSAAKLEQCCNQTKQCRNDFATLCYAKNRR